MAAGTTVVFARRSIVAGTVTLGERFAIELARACDALFFRAARSQAVTAVCVVPGKIKALSEA